MTEEETETGEMRGTIGMMTAIMMIGGWMIGGEMTGEIG